MLHYLVRSIQTIFNNNALESFWSGQENIGLNGVRKHDKSVTFICKTKKRKDRQKWGREEENVDRLSLESQSDCCLLSDEMGNTVSTARVIAFYFMFIFR